ENTKKPTLLISVILLLALSFGSVAMAADVTWSRKSSTTGDLPAPSDGKQQTCCLVLDIDKDGIDDFVIGERTRIPSVVWYKYNGKGWDKFVIDNTQLNPEAGGDFYDIDKDGDLDIVLGQDYSGNAIWWWENPYPDFKKPWARRLIKNSGARKHHDQAFGDFDGDEDTEFLSWNQGAKSLLLFEIPAKPKSTQPWPSTTIYSWSSGREREGFPSIGVDIDLDGKLDIVGGGRWFKHTSGTNYKENVIDGDMTFTQCAAGQLVKGGRPEVVFSPGDMNGDVKWYEWNGKKWITHKLRHVVHGHTCEIRDIDSDGNLDIFIGEMGNPGAGDKAKIYIWYGDGKGDFKDTIASQGQGIHEGKLGDLDGDGDLDILLKPYNHKTPRIDILLNSGAGWRNLFNGKDLAGFQDAGGGKPSDKWVAKDRALVRTPGAGMIWTKERFGDFILDLEFKTEGNSGIFFRTDKPADCVQTGIEMQVYNRVDNPGRHSCGAIYDALAPSKEMTKDGQFNHVTITALDNKITIVLNSEQIIDMDLNKWTESHKNPEPNGSKNKFSTPLKDFKREGHIGFQDHGANVWYRNIRIKRLSKAQ
ncbi:MAG: family 16 glycoside hydrolase, partial [Planctomycetota bacterium]